MPFTLLIFACLFSLFGLGTTIGLYLDGYPVVAISAAAIGAGVSGYALGIRHAINCEERVYQEGLREKLVADL